MRWVISIFTKYPWAYFCLNCKVFLPYGKREHCHHNYKDHIVVGVMGRRHAQ